MRLPLLSVCALGACAVGSVLSLAHAHDAEHSGGIASAPAKATPASFDLVHTRIRTEGNVAVFHIAVSGQAGAAKPAKSGKLAGSRVFSYVWPTTLNPDAVGFETKSGILAFAVTTHPDFDDTPLFDENGDGDQDNDGDVWHSHWVVLAPDEQCGKGALKVVDIPEGARNRACRRPGPDCRCSSTAPAGSRGSSATRWKCACPSTTSARCRPPVTTASPRRCGSTPACTARCCA